MFEFVIALVTLTALEIILGIDNIIFIAIIAGKLPPDRQAKARRLGLAVALIARLLLLASATYILRLKDPLFTIPELPMFHEDDARRVSTRDLILIAGGLFLIAKSVHEIHDKIERADAAEGRPAPAPTGFTGAIVNIAIMDIIFSLDSVITAVGMVGETSYQVGGVTVGGLWVMSTAVILAVVVMMVFANYVSNFVDRHPTIKVLALSFLILIGVMLTAEGLGQHMPKGYIYFAMAFSVVVEMLNIRIRPKLPQSSLTAKLTA